MTEERYFLIKLMMFSVSLQLGYLQDICKDKKLALCTTECTEDDKSRCSSPSAIQGICKVKYGGCFCQTGYFGPTCNKVCGPNVYGEGCTSENKNEIQQTIQPTTKGLIIPNDKSTQKTTTSKEDEEDDDDDEDDDEMNYPDYRDTIVIVTVVVGTVAILVIVLFVCKKYKWNLNECSHVLKVTKHLGMRHSNNNTYRVDGSRNTVNTCSYSDLNLKITESLPQSNHYEEIDEISEEMKSCVEVPVDTSTREVRLSATYMTPIDATGARSFVVPVTKIDLCEPVYDHADISEDFGTPSGVYNVLNFNSNGSKQFDKNYDHVTPSNKQYHELSFKYK